MGREWPSCKAERVLIAYRPPPSTPPFPASHHLPDNASVGLASPMWITRHIQEVICEISHACVFCLFLKSAVTKANQSCLHAHYSVL